MALKVWLPLISDIHNQGISNIIAESSNTSISSSGKIGSCYLFNGTNSYISLTPAPLSNSSTEFSYTCWFKPTTSHVGCLFSNRTSASSTGFTLFYYEGQIYFDAYDRWSFTPSIAITINEWNHLAFTYKKGGKKRFYINGTLANETDASSSAPTRANSAKAFLGGSQNSGTSVNANRLNGSLNDVRIYDNELSAAEVHEISQGLVLHYKLDEFQGGYGNPNLITNFDTSFLSYADGATTLFTNQMNSGTQEIVSNFAGTSKCLHLHSNGGNNRQYRTFSATANKTYTISADYYSTTIQTTAWRGELNGGDYNWSATTAGTYDIPGNWKRMSYTYSNLTSDATIFFFIHCSNGTDCYVKNIKIEEGSSATMWGPSGTPVTVIQDNSGYENNGTITGTITIDNNTPRYSSSTYVDGSSYILTPAGSFAWNDLTQLTFSAWMKPTASMTGWRGSVGIAADTTYVARGIAITDYANEFRGTYTNGSTYVTITTGKTLTQNEWHHCAGTLDDTTFKLYFDGELVKTQTINWGTATLNANARFEVGVDIPGTNEKFTGNYSDVRCYCTALSADDIKQLYELGAKINNLHAIHAYEFIENQSAIQLTKQGQFKCDEIVESTAAKIKDDKTLEATEFIEI